MLDRLNSILRRIIQRPENRNLPLWTLRQGSSAFAVPNAIEWLVRADADDCAELASELAGLMRKVRPREWTQLYASFRSPWIGPNDVPKLTRLNVEDAVEMLGVATLSANGFTREAAVQALGKLGHPRAVPYLLLRLGDWVGQVRDSAQRTLYRLMEADIASQLIGHHDLIDHLTSVQRVNLASVEAAIHAHLKEPKSRGAVEAGLAHERAATRRFCLRLLQDELESNEGLVTRVLQDPDPVVRRWFAIQVAHGEIRVSEDVFRRLLLDRASSVSTTVLRSMSDERAAAFVPDLIDLSLTDARPVRESARWALRSRGWTSFAEEARSRITSTERSDVAPGWIATLGETGNAETDFETVLRVVEHPRSRVRAAAVAALGKLDHHRAASAVVERLDDSSGIVRRAAIAVLAETPRHWWYKRARILVEAGTDGGQVAALHLLNLQSGWDTIPVLLQALLSENDGLVERAWQALHDWQHKHGTQGWLKPSEESRSEIAAIWPAVAVQTVPQWMQDAWSALRRDIEGHLDRGSDVEND